jgi:hypothetical protein
MQAHFMFAWREEQKQNQIHTLPLDHYTLHWNKPYLIIMPFGTQALGSQQGQSALLAKLFEIHKPARFVP